VAAKWHGKDDKSTQYLKRKTRKDEAALKDLGLSARIVLKSILKKQDFNM
jgi:hypothetical protein